MEETIMLQLYKISSLSFFPSLYCVLTNKNASGGWTAHLKKQNLSEEKPNFSFIFLSFLLKV